MYRLLYCAGWISLAIVLGLSGCVRPVDPELIEIVAAPQISGCGEYASNVAVDLHIRNLGPHPLRFDVSGNVRDPPVLIWSAYSVLDVNGESHVVDRRLSPGLPVPVVDIADHASIAGHDDGMTIALLDDVRSEDYAKTLRIELRDKHDRRYLSQPFALCGSKVSESGVDDTLPLSRRAARLLPLPVLAHLLLGSEGADVVDVLRPRYMGSFGQLTFYERARADIREPGICRARWVDIKLDEKGNVQSRTQTWRFGAPADLYEAPESGAILPGDARCAAQATTRDFFPAPDAQTAVQVARYMDVLNRHGPFANQVIDVRWREKDMAGAIPGSSLQEIRQVHTIACLPDYPEENACVHIQDEDGARDYRVYGVNRWNHVRIDRIEGSATTFLY